jgi:hypothetical protein
MLKLLVFRLADDISVKPDFVGIPENVRHGLVQLTDNAAAILLLVAGLGIVLSIIGMVAGSQFRHDGLAERSRAGLIVSASAGALLFIAVAFANYAMRTFR